MKLFDLHCDTLTKSFDKNLNFIDGNETDISISNSVHFEKWIQCLAIFTHDNYQNQDATNYFKNVVAYLDRLKSKNPSLKELSSYKEMETDEKNQFRYILTVENSSILNGKLENIDLIQKAGVKVISLTWNAANQVAGGIASDIGITEFGKMAVSSLEEKGIVIDTSHLNDRSFYDLCEIAEKPFIATHSNSREICHMQRNLKDDQIKEIFSRGGIVGINFYPKFIEQLNSKDYFDDFYAHIYHFLSLGGESHLSLGSDFDGCNLAGRIDNQLDVFRIYDYLLSRGLKESLLDDIFYNNAFNFIKNIIK